MLEGVDADFYDEMVKYIEEYDHIYFDRGL
jgi:hypothetical protein